MYQIRKLLLALTIFGASVFGTNAVQADEIILPFINTGIQRTISSEEQWDLFLFPGGGIGSYEAIFPTDHQQTARAELQFEVSLTYPGVVSPGDVVEIVADIIPVLAGPSSLRVESFVDYNFGFAISTDEGDFELTPSDLDVLPFPENPLFGLLTGSGSWSGADDTATAVTSSSTGTGGLLGISTGVAPGTPTEGWQLQTGGTIPAWNFPATTILDKIGAVFPGAGTLSFFYDIKLEADYDIIEQTKLTTDLFTAYYRLPGASFLDIEPLALNLTSGNPTLEIPDDIGLEPGDTFEIDIAALLLNGDITVDYRVDGFADYIGVLFPDIFGGIELGGFEDDKDNQLIASWTETFSSAEFYLDPLRDPFGTTMSFVIDGSEVVVSEPGTLALFGIGLLCLGLARRRAA